jgi:hypothetical protein
MTKYLLLLFLIGCGGSTVCKVESDTSWSGSFGDATVSESGNSEVDLPDDDIVCCVAQKQTTGGFLKITVVEEGWLGSSDKGSAETSAAYGVVMACNE